MVTDGKSSRGTMVLIISRTGIGVVESAVNDLDMPAV